MGEPCPPAPVTLICGLLAADEAVLSEALEALGREFGPRALESPVIPFDFTRYYEKQMGSRLLRKLVAFERPVDPGHLAAIKLRTNALEREIAARSAAGVPRPVNLDPGTLDGARLVLATTKDHAHRVYLGNGVYSEVTLLWHKGGFTHLDWTYPDYRSEAYRDFFNEVRRIHMGRAGG
jgi:hypothetical protein